MKKREYYFDNAKFILISLVVFGHFLQSFIADSKTIYTIYKVIYTFHMPAFILASGYFAKGFNKNGYVAKITRKLILPYLIFQVIYSVFYYFLNKESSFQVDPLQPHWSLWFLISLFSWNLMLRLFTKYKPIFSISAAFTIGILVGYFDWITNYLSLSRTFVFFPLFLIGYYIKREHFYYLNSAKIRIIAINIFAIVFIGFYMFPDINHEWLLGSKPYTVMGAAAIEAVLTRLGFYFLSLVMVFSFFTLVPKGQYFFTTLGKNTLYVYLLHGFFVRIFRVSSVQDYFSEPENYLLLAGISILLTLLLSSKIAIPFAQPLIELKTTKLKNLRIRAIATMRYYRNKLLN
ncbi:acyltransferase family protein [Cytobacillus depressus]|uniref:Acyltransferase family protein n=1 Tax=Cytobacillus depressus TaxID=1602942 RepID=A0A6L3V9T0_9BACI|nr:acyltransferase family protein [Cytobacillus depressus]KAB2337293.1 acyltransferase family protein [Cytobacillus depressus]